MLVLHAELFLSLLSVIGHEFRRGWHLIDVLVSKSIRQNRIELLVLCSAELSWRNEWLDRVGY